MSNLTINIEEGKVVVYNENDESLELVWEFSSLMSEVLIMHFTCGFEGEKYHLLLSQIEKRSGIVAIDDGYSNNRSGCMGYETQERKVFYFRGEGYGYVPGCHCGSCAYRSYIHHIQD
jgi:hypothetical protein